MKGVDILAMHRYCMCSEIACNDGHPSVLISQYSLNTPLSVAPMISGFLLIRWKWPSIFWFLSVLSPAVLLILFLFLPETCRRLVGNGSHCRGMSSVNRPISFILCPNRMDASADRQLKQQPAPKLPNPLGILSLLKDRTTLAAITCYGIYYMVHSCLQASTSTLFVELYHISGLSAGLIYIPFGVACSIASVVAGKHAGRNLRCSTCPAF